MNDLRMILDLAERAGATRYFQTPSFGATPAGAPSTPQSIRFTRPGFVCSLLGSIQSGTAPDFAGTSLRVQIGGTEDLFIDGQGGPAFSPFLALFGGIQNVRRVLRRVAAGDLWTFTVQNNTLAPIVALVEVAYLDDEDIWRCLQAVAAIKKAPTATNPSQPNQGWMPGQQR